MSCLSFPACQIRWTGQFEIYYVIKKISKIFIDLAKFSDSKNKQNITRTSFLGFSTEDAIFQKQSDLVYLVSVGLLSKTSVRRVGITYDP